MVAAWAEQVSREGPVAYIESIYPSGPEGYQKAIVWRDGAIAAGPFPERHGAVDQALRILGVERSGEYDEFDSVGLGRYRDTEKWAADAIVTESKERKGEP